MNTKNKVDTSCVECGGKGCRINNIHNVRLCTNCKSCEKYKLVCKTTALKTYCLSQDDIEDIEQHEGGYGSKYYILMKLSDVKIIFCEKYQVSDDMIENKLNELKLQKDERKNKIKNNKINREEKRKLELERVLNEYGVELRNDSKLCEKYIDGTLNKESVRGVQNNYTISDVVSRMCQMKYLYEYCNMDECYAEAHQNHTDELKAGYYPDCSVFDAAEDIALNKYGQKNNKYPKNWPWLENNN